MSTQIHDDNKNKVLQKEIIAKHDFASDINHNKKHKEGTKNNKGGNQHAHDNNKLTKREILQLTPEESNFAEYVVYEGLSYAKAYIKAYPEYEGPNKYRMGSYTANKENVKRYMEQLNTARVNNLAKNYNFIYDKYLSILENDDCDLKLQKQILDSLAKLNGMEVAKSVQLNAQLDTYNMTNEEIDNEIEKLRNMGKSFDVVIEENENEEEINNVTNDCLNNMYDNDNHSQLDGNN